MSAVFVTAAFVALFSAVSAKIFQIYHRDHFHDYLQNLPVGSRFASVVAFYNDTTECEESLSALLWSEDDLPTTEHLLLGQYEMSTTRDRVWYQWREHMDLVKYLGVEEYTNGNGHDQCPILVFIPSSYADEVGDDYLSNPSTENIRIWNRESEWKTWIWKNMMQTVRISVDIPFHLEVTVTHQMTNSYLKVISKPWSEKIKIDAIQSFTELQVFPGDLIQITTDPELTFEAMRKLYEIKSRENMENPSYMVHSAMDILNVVVHEDGTWGFGDDRIEPLTDHFIKKRHQITLLTHTRNLVLPLILPATHSIGFVKRKMPYGLHDKLVRFYRKWYHNKRNEDEEDGFNYFNVKTHMISLDNDPEERNQIANEIIKPVLLQWAHSNGWTNITDLDFHAFYGIREYSRVVHLENHVDRVDTHVFSAILQIAQSGVEEPWPLQVIGFDGKLLDITLEPGEMILYEGHKLIHGRPYPFNGAKYVNAFVHFSPKGWSWEKSMIWEHDKVKKMLKEYHLVHPDSIWED